MSDVLPWITGLLILGGSSFALIAGLGLLRLPDFYTRIHAATKASTLGLGLLSVAFVVHLGSMEAGAQAFVLVFFVFLTAPVAGHMLGRAAYRTGVEFPEGVEVEEDRGSDTAARESGEGRP